MRLHVSGLAMLAKCGEQYRRRYVEREKIPPGFAQTVGIATEASVNEDLEHKKAAGTLLPDEAVKDLARDALVKEWAKGVSLEEEYAVLGFQKAKAEAIDKSVVLASLHHSDPNGAPRIEPTHIQRYWRLDVGGLDLELSGIIDVQEGSRCVLDLKTSKKSPAGDEADKSLQLTTYSLALHQIDGQAPATVALTYLVHTQVPKLVRLESKRVDADYDHLLRRVENAHQIIKSGMFHPAPLDAWWCSKRFCGWYDTCKFVRHPVSVPVTGTLTP